MAYAETKDVPVARLIGFEAKEIADGRAVVTLAAGQQHANPMGTLHGGILCDIADAAMGMAFASTLAPGESFTTIELKINFFRPVWEARLRAEGKVVRRGSAIGYIEGEITDEGGRLVAKAASTCMAIIGERAKGRSTPSHRLISRQGDFRFKIAVEMGLYGAQRLLSSFKAVDHDCTLEGRNDESCQLLCIDSGADLPRFDSGADYRNNVAPPATQRLARALAQNSVSVIGIDRRVEQWTAAGNDSAPLDKIRNQLL